MSDDDAPEADQLLTRAAGGDVSAWGALLAPQQARLLSVISFRLDPRLRGRLDPADVMQDALIAATARRAEFFGQSSQSLFLWLRWMAGNTLLELHRHHLGAKMRDPKREQPAARRVGGGGGGADATTRGSLIAQLSCGATGPATAAGRAEQHARLNEALDQMDVTDREVLALRHFEQLTSSETAQVLGIRERAAAKRYLRALERLREVLAAMPGGLTGIRP